MTDTGKQIVVVTGGSRGLGRAISLAFAGPDTRIYFNYHSADASAVDTEKMIQAAGGAASFEKVNVASLEEVSGWFKRIAGGAGRIDVLEPPLRRRGARSRPRAAPGRDRPPPGPPRLI